MLSRRFLPVVLGSLAVAAVSLARTQEDEPARPAREATARVVLESLDGTITQRPVDAPPLRSLAAEGAAFARFTGIERDDADGADSGRDDPRDRAMLELSGGDRLSASIRGGDGDLLDVELRAGVPLQLSIDGIRSIVFPARIPSSVTESPAAGADGDRLYLVAADSLDRAEGFVESFAEDGVTFSDARLGSRKYGWNRVAALFITPLDDEPVDPDPDAEKAERVSVSLVGGGRIGGALVEIGSAEEGVLLRLGDAAEVRLPGSIVTEVTLDDGSFRFLGDLPPSDPGKSSPFDDDLGFVWPLRVDRNCLGGLLSVGGVEFARGIGVHAPSSATWSLGGEWSELRLLCGIDDSGVSGTRAGAVQFRVLGDGKKLWESEVVRAGAPAVRPDPIGVEGVKELVLEVDPAGDFVLDRANWLRPLLIR